MKTSRNSSILRSRSNDVTSGFCYIGSYDDNFHIIVKCPIHVFVVIKKAFAPSSVKVSFFTGTLPLNQLVAERYHGRFIYRDSSGKVKKYHAAFVYPLELDYEATLEEYQIISAVLSIFATNKFEYYDASDRSLKTLFTLFAKDFVEYLNSLVQAFDAPDPGAPTIFAQQAL